MNNKKGKPEVKIEKPKDFKGTFSKLIKFVSIYKIALIIVFVFAIGSCIFSIVGPKILGNATTELFNGLVSKVSGGTGIDFDKIGGILLTVLILYIVSAIFSYIEGLIMTDVSQKLTYKLRKQVMEKISKMPIAFFDKQTHGEILSVMTNDIDNMSTNFNQSATHLITSIVTVIGILIMMISINFTMTLITLLVLPISMVLLMVVVKKSQTYFEKQQEYLGHVNGNVEEMYSGHSVVKLFNAEDKMLNQFEENNEQLYKTGWISNFLSGLMYPIISFIGNLNYVAVAIVGGYLAIKGKITVGNIQSFIQYTRRFTNPIAQIAQISSMIQSMMASSERVFNFLENEEEVLTSSLAIKNDNIEGKVEFKNVHFGYEESKIIINDFSAKINSGEKVAIVGPTGAGKTTMVKLLMRFYKVNSGKILIDDHSIDDFNRDDLRNIFGMVLQDTWLFNGTIMENLRYGKLNATDDEIIEAAKNAHVHHFIQTLPDGYNMVLNEDTNNISGGQKQLLTIARAILANPKVLILDEATSNVDTRTEILINKAMNELMKNRTTFIIAHRLSTIKNADLIIVMNEGDIVEIGKHDDLLVKNGFYAKLYNSQFEE